MAFELFNIHRNGSRVSPGDNIAQFKEHAAQSMAHEARAIKAATTVHKHRHGVLPSVLKHNNIFFPTAPTTRWRLSCSTYIGMYLRYSLVIIQHDKNTCHSEHAARRTTYYASYQGCVNRASTKVCCPKLAQIRLSQLMQLQRSH